MTGFADVLNVVHLFVAALVSETYGYVDRTKQPICICIYIYINKLYREKNDVAV
jgi:hypothetical protein